MNFTDRIRPTDKGITTYLDELENLDYQIPTFQRDVVWEKENVKDHDCALYVEKQRYGEWEGGFYLWFHPKSMQYTPDSRNIPMNWFKQNDKYNQT